jgi:hypothetical protein
LRAGIAQRLHTQIVSRIDSNKLAGQAAKINSVLARDRILRVGAGFKAALRL